MSKLGTTGGSLREMLKMPEYHNLDPLVRLIGEANEAPAIVEGIPITSLVDSGACMSAMVKSFAKELQLEIKLLKTILDIEGMGGWCSTISWVCRMPSAVTASKEI